MASVTKTITESVGEIQKTTTLYFASFEDFMEYERVVNEKGQQDNQSGLEELEVGKQYRVIEEVGDILLPKGTVLVVVGNVDSDGEYKAELLDGSNFWYVKPEEVEEI